MGIDLGVREQQLAGQRIDRAIVQHQADLHRVRRDAVEVAALERAAQLIEFVHRLGEVGIDRIELLDGRQARGLVLHHQRAFADQRGADDAVDRGADGRIIQIEFGAGDVGLAALDVGLRLLQRGNRLFVLGFRHRALAEQRRNAPRLQRRLFERGLRPRQRRFVRLQFHVKRPRIDPVERIAGPDFAALAERALDDDAGDARTHVGHARRRDASGQFAHHRARLRLYGDDADVWLGRWCCGGGDIRFIAATEQRRRRGEHQCNAGRSRAKSRH